MCFGYVFYFLPDGRAASFTFHGGGEFPCFGVVDATVEADAFISVFFPLVSLLDLHVAMVM